MKKPAPEGDSGPAGESVPEGRGHHPLAGESEATGESLAVRLASVLGEILPVGEESDGSLTVHHDGTFASLRVVAIAENLELVSLTQMLAWDVPLSNDIRDQVASHAGQTLLGTVALVEKPDSADVLLRYNFPGAGLTDDALRTLILMVLSTGADVRRALVP
jgi:hypothetical protein